MEPLAFRAYLECASFAIYGKPMAAEKTTVYLDPVDHRRLKALAAADGRPTAELIREAVAEYVRRRGEPRRAASVGSGRSGRGDVAERSEELLDGFGEEA
jgi:predicted transcriptional regulator